MYTWAEDARVEAITYIHSDPRPRLVVTRLRSDGTRLYARLFLDKDHIADINKPEAMTRYMKDKIMNLGDWLEDHLQDEISSLAL